MKTKVIHQTDLFHPPADPDDHWDLACQFALDNKEDIELKGILVDYPPTKSGFLDLDTIVKLGDPSIQSINQLNYIFGKYVPVAIGTNRPFNSLNGKELHTIATQNSGVRFLLETLRDSEEPVVVHIVGSCRDIAIAGKIDPELFKSKCKAIYLNAGTSKLESKHEYNVTLDQESFNYIFNLKCPIYWMPCLEKVVKGHPLQMGEYCTYFKFKQKEILPYLSTSMQKYFTYALEESMDNKWFSYLQNPLNNELIKIFEKNYRNMWCTAGFIHSSGNTVTAKGEIIKRDRAHTESIFDFKPIKIINNKQGIIEWELSDKDTDRFIFHVEKLDKYSESMTNALKTILTNVHCLNSF